MKKPKSVSLLFTLFFLFLSFAKPSYSSTEPQESIPRILDKTLTDKTLKSEYFELLKSIENKKETSENKELLKFSKAFLFYKTDNFKEALRLAREINPSELEDLKYFIIADSSRMIASSPERFKAQESTLNLLSSSITYFKRIIFNYKASPLLELSKANLLKARISLADYYLEMKGFEKAQRQYLLVISFHKGEFSKEDIGRLYSKLGEAFFEGKDLKSAQKAYTESSKYITLSEGIKERFDSISSSLPSKKDGPKLYTKSPDKNSVEPSLPVNVVNDTRGEKPELDIFDKANDRFQALDYAQSIKFSAKLIKEYPGSFYIKDTRELAVKSVKAIADAGKNIIPWGSHYKTKLLDAATSESIGKLDLESRITISSMLYRLEFLSDVESILDSIIKEYPYSDFVPKAYLILSRIYRVLGLREKSIEALNTLCEKYSGSDLVPFAKFRMGLTYFENKDFDTALKYFTKYLAEASQEKRAQALWWIGKTFERLNKKEQSDLYYSLIRKENPLSFYAVIESSYSHLLRLTLEEHQNYAQATSYIKDILSLDDENHLKRALAFMQLGLFDFSGFEIRQIKNTATADADIYLAWLANQTGFYKDAISLAARASSKDPSSVNKNLLSLFFPKEYLSNLTEQSLLYGVDHLLLLSLIKQESAFDQDAVSSSGAIGLMQIMPFTADEVSSRLFIADAVPRKTLRDSSVNIPLSTFYFYNLLKNSNGNIVNALASYNAGPMRLREWSLENPNLSDMEFIEEIPVEETNQYVKNILRNYIVYSYLADRKLVPMEEIKKGSFYKSVLINPD